MKIYDVIIIGAGPSAIVAGATAKKQNPEKSMLMVKEEEKGLVPCGIPYVFYRLGNLDKNVMGPKPFIDLGGDDLYRGRVALSCHQMTTSQGFVRFAINIKFS